MFYIFFFLFKETRRNGNRKHYLFTAQHPRDYVFGQHRGRFENIQRNYNRDTFDGCQISFGGRLHVHVAKDHGEYDKIYCVLTDARVCMVCRQILFNRFL